MRPTSIEATPTADPFADLRGTASPSPTSSILRAATAATGRSSDGPDGALADDLGGFDGSWYADGNNCGVGTSVTRLNTDPTAAGSSSPTRAALSSLAARQEDSQITSGAEESLAPEDSEQDRDETAGRPVPESDSFMAKYETGMRGLSRFMQLMRR